MTDSAVISMDDAVISMDDLEVKSFDELDVIAFASAAAHYGGL
jgi:hypothetical protein